MELKPKLCQSWRKMTWQKMTWHDDMTWKDNHVSHYSTWKDMTRNDNHVSHYTTWKDIHVSHAATNYITKHSICYHCSIITLQNLKVKKLLNVYWLKTLAQNKSMLNWNKIAFTTPELSIVQVPTKTPTPTPLPTLTPTPTLARSTSGLTKSHVFFRNPCVKRMRLLQCAGFAKPR